MAPSIPRATHKVLTVTSHRLRWLTALLFLSLPVTADDLVTTPDFVLDRYLGRWHQIALLPNRFQADCAADTSAAYSRRQDGGIEVVNQCRDAAGEWLRVTGEVRVNREYGDPARLEVRFAPAWLGWLPMVWGDYWILDIDADYTRVLVGSPDRRYLWILARAAQISAADYAALVAVARAAGFATAQLELESPAAVIDKRAASQP